MGKGWSKRTSFTQSYENSSMLPEDGSISWKDTIPKGLFLFSPEKSDVSLLMEDILLEVGEGSSATTFRITEQKQFVSQRDAT